VTPLTAECPACGGTGCDGCGRTGRFDVTACPLRWIGSEIWEMIEMTEFYDKGIAPVAGGLLDQTAYFVKFAAAVRGESEQYKTLFDR
jgi:hypothetical protein